MMRRSFGSIVKDGVLTVEPEAIATSSLQGHARTQLRIQLLESLAERDARVQKDSVLLNDLAETALDHIRSDAVASYVERSAHSLLDVRGDGCEVLGGHIAGHLVSIQEGDDRVVFHSAELVAAGDLNEADMGVKAVAGGVVVLLECRDGGLFVCWWCHQRPIYP